MLIPKRKISITNGNHRSLVWPRMINCRILIIIVPMITRLATVPKMLVAVTFRMSLIFLMDSMRKNPEIIHITPNAKDKG